LAICGGHVLKECIGEPGLFAYGYSQHRRRRGVGGSPEQRRQAERLEQNSVDRTVSAVQL